MRLGPTSLRHRLVLAATATGLVFAVAFGTIAVWSTRRAEDQAVHDALLSRLELARNEVSPDGLISQKSGSLKSDLVQVVGPDGVVRSSSPSLSGFGPLTDVSSVSGPGADKPRRVTLASPDADLAVLAVSYRLVARGAFPAGNGALVVAIDVEGYNATTSDLAGLLIAGLLLVVTVIGTLTWVLTGRALRSVTALTEDAESALPYELSSGLPMPPHDAELARLVGALNRMLVRLDATHASELAFAADAGHRLRTPVATLRAEAELAQGEQDPAEVTAALARIVEDADQLSVIVDRMLARARAGSHPPEPVVGTLRANFPRWTRQATVRFVRVDLTVDPRLDHTVRCRDLIEILDPIVDNATRHTPDGGRITIDGAQAPSGEFVVEVANTGSVIAPAMAEHLFEAWASSRDASTAGGLGLWLARETARDLGGDVILLEEANMTTFRVRLPVSD